MDVHLRAWLDEQVSELRAQAAIALADTDIEGVHQLRVAVRRLRAALKTGVAGAGELRRELRWFFGKLGPVRDLDVLLARFRADTAGFSPDELAAVERLLGGLVAERAAVQAQLVKVLRGKRYARLLATLEAAEPVETDGVVVDLVAAIAEPHERLRAAVAALPFVPADEDLHALRILGKKLRYAAEMAEPVGGKPVRKLVKATRKLQDVLGEFQDSCVAEERLRGLTPAGMDEAFVAGRLVEREHVRQGEMRAQWYDAYVGVDQAAELVR